MIFPTLNPLKTSRESIEIFKGYNHNIRIGSGEFYEMENLSSDNYPLLSPRCKRGIYESPENPNGMIAKGALCYVDGGDFVIGNERIPMNLSDSRKALISMGANVIIMPDKKYINTTPQDDGSYESGEIEASVVTSGTVSFTLSRADGSAYGEIPVQTEAPSNPSNLSYWIDTSATPHALKQYSASSGTWASVVTTYIKIAADGIGAPFAVDDGVSISGIEDTAIAEMLKSAIIQDRADDYIIVKGMLDKVSSQTLPVTVERRMPNMDFIIESENRLWGCRYGAALNGKIVNEIYASKLGDFKNWNCFAGISTDSYAVSIGTDGPFTGAITYLGHPIFFKETCMHKIFGNYPSNFQVQMTTLRGVQKGCENSLAIVNEVLFYKARSGICAYDGSLPVEISAALGDVRYNNAAAGALANKYYISMSDTDGGWHLFVYDTLKGVWHREDATQAELFCNFQGDLYFIDHATEQIKTVKGTGVPEAAPIKWSATTGIIGTDSPGKKYISSMDVRMSIEVGARIAFYAEYDSCGEYEYLFTMVGKSLQSFSVPVRTRRCDHLRIRIVGTGNAQIFSIYKTTGGGQ